MIVLLRQLEKLAMELSRIEEHSATLHTRLSELRKTVDLTPAEFQEMGLLQVGSEERESDG